jgi:hypothetical protein
LCLAGNNMANIFPFKSMGPNHRLNHCAANVGFKGKLH